MCKDYDGVIATDTTRFEFETIRILNKYRSPGSELPEPYIGGLPDHILTNPILDGWSGTAWLKELRQIAYATNMKSDKFRLCEIWGDYLEWYLKKEQLLRSDQAEQQLAKSP